MILVRATLQAISEETRPALRSLLIDMGRDSRAETGCIAYRFTADLEDDLLFHVTELWEDEETALAHARGPVFVRFKTEFPALGSLVESVWMTGDLKPFVRPGSRQSVR